MEKAQMIHCVTTSYGNQYAPLLLSFLESVTKSNPSAKVTVLWSETDQDIVDTLAQAYPQAIFEHTTFGNNKKARRRFDTTKAESWVQAIHRYPTEWVCHVDSDMIILKDLAHFFHSDADILFPYREDRGVPVNLGVLLTKNSPRVIAFLEEFVGHVESNLSAPEEEIKKYGNAPDQMAWVHLLHFSREKTNYQIETKAGPITLKAVPCRLLNKIDVETPITEDTHIMHYKGKKWHPVFFQGGLFNRYRIDDRAFDLYRYFLKEYIEGLKRIEKINKDVTEKYFSPFLPSYIHSQTLRKNKIKYFFFYIRKRPWSVIRFPFSRLYRFIKNFLK